MAAKMRKSRIPDLDDVATDALPNDVRREDIEESPPDLPPAADAAEGAIPAGGGFSPSEDGGNPQHPVHDEDQEDIEPSDYERELDRLDALARDRG